MLKKILCVGLLITNLLNTSVTSNDKIEKVNNVTTTTTGITQDINISTTGYYSDKKAHVKIVRVLTHSTEAFPLQDGSIAYILEDYSYIIKSKNDSYIFYSSGDMEEYRYNTYEDLMNDIHFIPIFVEVI